MKDKIIKFIEELNDDQLKLIDKAIKEILPVINKLYAPRFQSKADSIEHTFSDDSGFEKSPDDPALYS